ncbi:LuxR C-terminal-related transcriptional regulator [Streptomyces sp. NPDC004126]|uniref:response regulator transcription factor n=1 Tax=Streptomyces sp. NPDC004126 TaxID=3390695 RepID=UPI003D0013E3
MVRVLVVDDEALIREGLRFALSGAPDITLTSAVPVAGAVAAVRRETPEVVLLDACTLDANALAAGFGSVPSPPVVCVLSRSTAPEHLAAALEAGAGGFVPKQVALEAVVPLVRMLAAGVRAYGPDGWGRSRTAFLAEEARRAAAAAEIGALTARERDVAALLATGRSNAEVGAHLGLSPATVKDHVSAILGKLGTANRVRAAVLADRAGLRPPPQVARPAVPYRPGPGPAG